MLLARELPHERDVVRAASVDPYRRVEAPLVDLPAARAKLLHLVLDDAKTGKNLLPKVGALESTVSVILAVQPERISYFVALGKNTAGDCRTYIKLLNDTFGGRGGGKPDGAQGGADFCPNWQEKLDEVLAQLKEL